jgi:hypothetical protein
MSGYWNEQARGSEDGESFAMTEDYSDSRINLEILVGLVVAATAW